MSKEEPKPHRSVSQLLSYASCSEKYRLERIARVPQRPAAWTIGGNAVHTGIEEWEKSDRTLTADQVEDIVITDYRNRANKLIEEWEPSYWMTGGRKKGEDDLSDREDKAVLQVRDYMVWATSQEHLWCVEDSEVEFNLEFGGVVVRGYIDQIVRRVDGSLLVRDLKSGNKVPGSPIQLAVYAHAVQDLYKEPVGGGEFAMLMNPSGRSAASQTVKLIEFDLTENPTFKRGFLDQFFSDLERGIQGQVFLPNADDSCTRICSVSQYCRAVGTTSSAMQHQEGLLKTVAS